MRLHEYVALRWSSGHRNHHPFLPYLYSNARIQIWTLRLMIMIVVVLRVNNVRGEREERGEGGCVRLLAY